ncbi:MAG: response regulator [Proteobacteria bacterium]|nr:response regulator [Pseudomonadota bacterium]
MRNKIVVADDSTTVQKVIKLILSPRGYEIESYTNGEDAFDSIKRNIPAVVIADAVMAGMNGVELGHAMKKESKELGAIPLILMHSSFEDVSTEDFLKSGAREKLAKPFDDKQLLALMEKYMLQGEDIDAGDLSWDMESFVKPEIPDMKNPVKTIVKHGGDIDIDIEDRQENEQPPIFKVPDDEKIEELGIPDVDKFVRSKSEQIVDEEDADFGPEVISEDEAKKLMEEFKIKENSDGTINFDEMENAIEDSTRQALERIEQLSDPDIGLWSEKHYGQVNTPGTSLSESTITLDTDEESIPSINAKDIPEDKELIIAVTKEVVEKIVRQMLPDIAERVIKEEIKKIVGS